MCSCTDKGYAPHLHRDIMLTKTTITLILTSLGIIYVEPQGTTILCILKQHVSTMYIYSAPCCPRQASIPMQIPIPQFWQFCVF